MVFTSQKPRTVGQILLIESSKIIPNKNQPREIFPTDELKALSVSIRQNGIIQPLTVRKKGEYYELIAGERRLRASKMAGLNCVPCIIMETDDKNSAVIALIENIQRRQLNFIEEAKGLDTLLSYYGMRQEEVANAIGKSQSAVSNLLRLLQLSPEVQEKLIEYGLTQRHARALLKLPEKKQTEALTVIAEKGLNVSQTEKYIENLLSAGENKEGKRKTKIYFTDVKIFLKTISHAVETMQSAGIKASVDKTEDEESFTFVVRVPKNPK